MTLSPALTPEEWTVLLAAKRFRKVPYGSSLLAAVDPYASGFSFEGTDLCADSSGGEYSDETFPRHALAALCLHGQTFGFTRADVRHLRQIAHDFYEEGAASDAREAAGEVLGERGLWGINATACRARSIVFASLASRIEALLPPSDA